MKGGVVYILTNRNNTTLYVGVTSNLQSRLSMHLSNFYPASFTSRYNLYKLVYYKSYSTITEAIEIERRIKGWSRAKKDALIDSVNPAWDDLGKEVLKW
jgi:putative endonuclease